jgi:hypothetical protein
MYLSAVTLHATGSDDALQLAVNCTGRMMFGELDPSPSMSARATAVGNPVVVATVLPQRVKPSTMRNPLIRGCAK